MIQKLIRIFNYFGHENQMKKAREEFHESIGAYLDFEQCPSKDNILALFEEIDDWINVLEGIAICQYGLNIEEIHASKNMKLNRTLKIIEQAEKENKTYDQVRRS